MDFSQFTLDNGLRVIHHRDTTTSRAVVNVLYNVGARDELPELTGMAHLFEHLMFGGSINVPDYDRRIELAGGWNNAWTSNDFTNFYSVLPAANVETAFWLESDRMNSLSFNPKALEVQRQVVMEEFKQVCLNKPYGDFSHHLRSLLWRVHPYRTPTIGKELSHIERVTDADIRKFFFSHYAPNNAVLAVVGNVELERIKEMAEKWFGPLPRRLIAPRLYEQEPPIESPRHKEVEADVPQTMLAIAFPMGAYGSADFAACDIITDILASGRSSRLYRNLVMGRQIFTTVDASIAGSEEPGYISVSGRIKDNTDEAIACGYEALWEEIDRLKERPVSDYELQSAVNRYESNQLMQRISPIELAPTLAMTLMHGEDINKLIEPYRALTPDDIQRAAREHMRRESSVTLTYRARQQQ